MVILLISLIPILIISIVISSVGYSIHKDMVRDWCGTFDMLHIKGF
jgi:hypothetical protein